MPSLPHDEEFELYHYEESLCSQMVRLALVEKGYAWKSHVIALEEVAFDGDNLSDAYLKVNPKGQVPTLVHDGEPVFDSYEIIRYLDALHPERGPRLIPDDPALDERMRGWVLQSSLRDDVEFGRSLGTSIPVLSAPIIKALIDRQPMLHVLRKFRRHPVPSRRANFCLLRLTPLLPREVYRKSLASIAEALVSIERALGESAGEFLLGEFTQADVMMTAHFHRLEDVAVGELLAWDRLPRIAAYWERLQARPAYAKAVTSWHEENWRSAIDEVFGGRPSPRLPDLRRRVSNLLG